MMSTDSNRSSENRYQRSLSAGTPQRAEAENDLPGATPPAAWFLRLPANAQAASPPADTFGTGSEAGEPDPGEPDVSELDRGQPDVSEPDPGQPDPAVTGAWVASAAPESGESPISWYEGMDDPGPEAEPSAVAADEPPAPPITRITPITPVSPSPAPGRGDDSAAARYQRPVLAARPVVSPTRALRGRPGGPGFQPKRPAPGTKKVTAGQSPWQASHRLWSESEIPWEQHPANDAPPYAPAPPEAWPRHARPPLIPAPRSPQRPLPDRPARPAGQPPEPPTGPHPAMRMPLGAPVYAEPRPAPPAEPQAGRLPAAPPLWTRPPEAASSRAASDALAPDHRPAEVPTMLLEPELPGTWRPGPRHSLLGRRTATIVIPVIVLVAVAVLALAMLTGHDPKLGPLAASQPANPAPHLGTTPLTIGMYPGQQQRGVFQSVNRVVANGHTIVTMGSQTSDGVVRQQFFVSANGGASWRLAPVQASGGGEPPLGYPAARLAGGPGGWLAVGPQAIWTSPDGLSWTLAATHGITPMLPGDGMWVLNSTSSGFLAAGVAADGGQATQAVIWTSRDGLTWQRETAAQLGLAGPGETVQSISYITSRGPDTVISGQVSGAGTTYAGVWLSTDGGSTWTRVTVPADHGAGTAITGLAFDGSGLLAVRPGRSASGATDAVAYFSPNGTRWQYAGTIGAAAGWTPSLVKGSDYGFVVAGTSAAGQLVAFTAAGTGTTWPPTGSLGDAGTESVVGATVASAGAIVAVGYTAPGQAGQQPVFLAANAAGRVRPVSLAGIPGGSIPELAVNGLAVAAGQQIAVGSAEGYPAVWRRSAGGSWALVTSLSQVSGGSGLAALTGVTHGRSGWLAVGAPGPVVMTSADGTSWRSATGPGSITAWPGRRGGRRDRGGPARLRHRRQAGCVRRRLRGRRVVVTGPEIMDPRA